MAETIDPKTGVATSASTFDDILEAIAIHGDAATHGVVPGVLNELEVTGTSSPVAVNSGWAIVKGKLFRNTASKNVVVASPAVSTRIDRVVVLIDYTATPETGTITLIAGAEGGAAPSLAAYQVDGTQWALPLAQVSITTGGAITVTDERKKLLDGQITKNNLAADCVDGSKIGDDSIDSEHYVDGSIDTAHLANDAVDDSKAGARVTRMVKRQGGGASDWHTPGTDDYTPTTVIEECGSCEVTISNGQASGYTNITFATAFGAVPIVNLTLAETPVWEIGSVARESGHPYIDYANHAKTGTRVQFTLCQGNAYGNQTKTVFWRAVGPE